MRFLKKMSIEDILNIKNKQLEHYKEIELFTNSDDFKNGEIDTRVEEIINRLDKYKARITAVHSPESRLKTICDDEKFKSSNYLSLCEVLFDKESFELFKKVLDFIEKIQSKQLKKNQIQRHEEHECNENSKEKKIILIMHVGCQIGCNCNSEWKDCKLADNERGDIMMANEKDSYKEFFDIVKEKKIAIAFENITPFLNEKSKHFPKGKNCGYSDENIKAATTCNNMSGTKQFGVCVDFCHLIATEKILNKKDYLKDYFGCFDNENMSLIQIFHLSNYSSSGEHGAQFIENTDLLEKIRGLCLKYAANAPITLEVAEGYDLYKARNNFDKMVYDWSRMDNVEPLKSWFDKDISKFFEDLFVIYSTEVENTFEIAQNAAYVKQFVFDNTFVEGEKLFSFSEKADNIDITLFRVQAYVYFTRFCNLARYLVKKYNEIDISITTEKNCTEWKKRDFNLAIRYYMFNDEIHEVEFTGLAFHMNMDWFMRKDTIFRFNDGWYEDRFTDLGERDAMKCIMKNALVHINGRNSGFSSWGKNFGQCMVKYYRIPKHKEDWSLMILKDTLINFIVYDNELYSLQAFRQIKFDMDDEFYDKICKLSIDLSVFRKGRDGENDASSLNGLMKVMTGYEIKKETCASITDEEVLIINKSDLTNPITLYETEFYLVMLSYLKLLEVVNKEKDIEKEKITKISEDCSACIEENVIGEDKISEESRIKCKNILSCLSINEKHRNVKYQDLFEKTPFEASGVTMNTELGKLWKTMQSTKYNEKTSNNQQNGE
ncbi:UNVERIFIED_ORG: hypothetical protein B2H98_02495 [Clostridium botulinum]